MKTKRPRRIKRPRRMERLRRVKSPRRIKHLRRVDSLRQLQPLKNVLLMLLIVAWLPVQAHEIPNDVQIQVLVIPEGQTVEVSLRVPLAAMRDFEFASRGPGYLDLARVIPQLEEAAHLWLLQDLALFAAGAALGDPDLDGVRIALPSDQSFAEPARARAAILGEPLPLSTNLYWEQALLDVALTYANPAGPDVDFSIEPRFARLGMTTLTRVTHRTVEGQIRSLTLPGNPGRVSLDPSAMEVFGRFFGLGFEHVLDGTDHLLFVLALIIPLLVIRPLIVVITAFTLAHSLTLGAAMLGLVPTGLWFPPLVELLIAASIFYMALENLLAPNTRRRWLIAFGFGLVHGFGFSFALTATLERAGDHLLTSLAGFNLGIEAGQLLVLVVAVPVIRLVGRWLPRQGTGGQSLGGKGLAVVLSVLIGHTAWHWLLERWVTFSAFDLTLPTIDRAFAVGAMRWALLVVVAVFVVWLVRAPFERWAQVSEPEKSKS